MIAEHAELYRRIAAFSIDEPGSRLTFTARLAKENGWSRDYAKRVVEEYKKFAFLAVAAGHPVSPSEQVDQAWHLHLTYTHSYWDRFCGEVLGRPLHHNPSKGGPVEREKFLDWYNQTLESYQRFFGQEPAADIWPDTEKRFGEDLHYRRVNTRQNWIVPKRPLKWLAASTVLVLAGLLNVAGCVPTDGGNSAIASPPIAAATIPNLFDLPGRQFLGIFAGAFAVAVCIAAVIRWHMRRTADQPSAEAIHLEPYEVAYLAGGEEAAVNAALGSLVSREALQVEAKDRRLLRHDENLSALQLHPVEEAVLEAVDPESGSSIDEVHRSWPAVSEIAERLKSLGLIVSDERDWLGRVLPVLIVLAVPLLGVIKILIGLSRDKPIGFLVIASVVAVTVAFAAFGRRLHRSQRGDRVLEGLKSQNAALQPGVGRAVERLRALHSGSDVPGELVGTSLALAVALFGVDVLSGGPFASLHTALKPRTDSDGGSGYAGGCGGGDGGCGGGCGGCGGCG